MATDWEQTFRNWSKPSSDDECEKQENAERMIGDAIWASDSLKNRKIKIIPQGSYRNNTNVRQESDVDICVCCMEPFFGRLRICRLQPGRIWCRSCDLQLRWGC